MKIIIAVMLSVILLLFCYPLVDMQAKKLHDVSVLEEKAALYSIESVTVTLPESGEAFEISYRDYLIGCLFAQIPAFYESEMLKAQAIAANTYNVYLELNGIKCAKQSNDGKASQQFISEKEAKEYYGDNYNTAYQKISEAVDFGMNYVITYDGEPILAAYHGISSGVTDNATDILGIDYPYLISRDSPADIGCDQYSGSRQLSTATVRGLLMTKFDKIKLPADFESWFHSYTHTACGTIISVKTGEEELSGTELADIFSLRSANVNISYADGFFTFSTKGYGNNIGMSLYGGNEMVINGAQCADVLLYYYDGVKIEKIQKIPRSS